METKSLENSLWFDGKNINEALFCQAFLREHKITFTNRAFQTEPLPLYRERPENREAAKQDHHNIFAFLALYPAESGWFHPLQRPVCHLPNVV